MHVIHTPNTMTNMKKKNFIKLLRYYMWDVESLIYNNWKKLIRTCAANEFFLTKRLPYI